MLKIKVMSEKGRKKVSKKKDDQVVMIKKKRYHIGLDDVTLSRRIELELFLYDITVEKTSYQHAFSN